MENAAQQMVKQYQTAVGQIDTCVMGVICEKCIRFVSPAPNPPLYKECTKNVVLSGESWLRQAVRCMYGLVNCFTFTQGILRVNQEELMKDIFLNKGFVKLCPSFPLIFSLSLPTRHPPFFNI